MPNFFLPSSKSILTILLLWHLYGGFSHWSFRRRSQLHNSSDPMFINRQCVLPNSISMDLLPRHQRLSLVVWSIDLSSCPLHLLFHSFFVPPSDEFQTLSLIRLICSSTGRSLTWSLCHRLLIIAHSWPILRFTSELSCLIIDTKFYLCRDTCSCWLVHWHMTLCHHRYFVINFVFDRFIFRLTLMYSWSNRLWLIEINCEGSFINCPYVELL